MDEISIFLKWAWGMVAAFFFSLLCPIKDFVSAILILATINIILGAIADSNWSMKKAYRAFVYLGGYLLLLLITVLLTRLMHISHEDSINITSWITWVMIWFYVVNILRNWNVSQPSNKVIKFIYWVVSFKAIEKIKYLKEFNDLDAKDSENDTIKEKENGTS